MALYIFPNDTVNIFNPSSAHIKSFADIQTSINKEYEPIKPLTNTKPPFFAQKLKTADEVEQALQAIKHNNLDGVERKARQIYARIGNSMRANPEEMLQLIANHPRAFSLIDSSLHTQDFYLKALERNHRVYDLLPKHKQQDQEIINTYREGVFKHPVRIQISATTAGWDAMHCSRIGIPAISPKCPIEKFATTEAYKDIMRQVFRYEGMPRTIRTGIGKDNFVYYLGEAIGAALTLRRLAPHLQQEFAQAEKEAYQDEKETFLKGASIREHGVQYETMKDFTDKHNLPDVRNEYMVAAWHNHCRREATKGQLPAPSIMKNILENCPQEIARQYFDMRTGELPSSHPAIIAAEQEAVALRQRMQQEPHGNYDKEILRMIETGPISVMKANIDFEGYIRRAAMREEYTLAGELITPIRNPQGSDKTYALETALRDQQNASEHFAKSLHGHPEYETIYREELQKLQEARAAFTPEEKNFRFTQQWAYEYPQGSRQLDQVIVQCLQKFPPDQYEKHLDIKDYLERRTEYFKDSYIADQKKAAEQFKALIAQSPAAIAIVENKLIQMGILDPAEWLKTPLARYTFSQEITPTIRNDSPTTNKERLQDVERSGLRF